MSSSKWSVRDLVEFLRKDVEALVVRVNDLALALDELCRLLKEDLEFRRAEFEWRRMTAERIQRERAVPPKPERPPPPVKPPEETGLLGAEAVVDKLVAEGFNPDDFEITAEKEVVVVKPKRYLGEDWRYAMDALRTFRARWIRAGKNSRWEVPRK